MKKTANSILRSIIRSTIGFVILAALVIGILLSDIIKDPTTVGLTNASEIDTRSTERLYRKLGVLKVPRIAPPVDFRLLNLKGEQVRLSDFEGKIVFLNFWTTWCYDCRKEMPSMEKLYARMKETPFAVVAVSLQEPAVQVKAFADEFKLTFPILLDSDGKSGRLFGIRSIPSTFIIDRDGGIIGKVIGSREWDGRASMALVRHLINRKADATPESKGPAAGAGKQDFDGDAS